MTPVGRTNASLDPGDKDSTSSTADEQNVSGLPDGAAGFYTASRDFSISSNVYDAQASYSDPLGGSAALSAQLTSINASSSISSLSPMPSNGSGATLVNNGSLSNSPGSVVAVTTGGITINLLFDAAAMLAPASFRAGIQHAATMLTAAISDQITVNLNIHYSGTGGGASRKLYLDDSGSDQSRVTRRHDFQCVAARVIDPGTITSRCLDCTVESFGIVGRHGRHRRW